MPNSPFRQRSAFVQLSDAAYAENQRLAYALCGANNFSGILPILLDTLRLGGASAQVEIADLIQLTDARRPGHGQKLARELVQHGAILHPYQNSNEPTQLAGGPDGGGVVHVDAYTQDRHGTSTDVSSYTRSAHGSGGGGDIGPRKLFSPNPDDYHKSDGIPSAGKPAPKILPIPDREPRPGSVGGYNSRRHGDKGYYQHCGQDILSTPGKEEVSLVSGKVTSTGVAINPRRGEILRYVEVDMGNGYIARTLYVQPTVKVGDTVTAGESKIGRAQDLKPHYGADMPNHIHFEVYDTGVILNNGRTDPGDRKRNKRIDPAPFLWGNR